MRNAWIIPATLLALLLAVTSWGAGDEKPAGPLRVLILDGRNNHDWRGTTQALRASLEATGRFAVEVESAPESGLTSGPRRPRTEDAEALARFEEARKRHLDLRRLLDKDERAAWAAWNVDFAKYDAVVLNYNGPEWSPAMKQRFVDYVHGGGGVFLVHAANNGFSNWEEFNAMIGLGWRKQGFGKAVMLDGTGKLVGDEAAGGSGHGAKHPFVVTVRDETHPVMKGLPTQWMHGRDELYHRMRGSMEGLRVLSSAYSDPKQNGTGNHEPITWEKTFGQGRVMVTSMGHLWAGDTQMDSLHCAGFQTILCRGVEYVATGAVTLDVPATFPSETETTIVPPHRMPWSGRVEAKDRTDWKAKKEQSVFAKLDVKESREAFELAEGYEISAVASEPDLEEPVVVVWDGNGVMYVAEMRSYMQDVEGTGTKTLRNGRVKRLEDTNGDGSYDRVTVFIDKLNLPRMLLPLDDRLAVVETDTTSVFSYRDIDGDGVADKKVPLWNGREIPVTKSVEHQDSGLIWNIDNNIYVSYGHTRYRFTDGTWTGVRGEGLWAQWGLDFDETGQIFYSTNSEPFFSSQMPREYWGLIRHRGGTMPRDPEPVSYGKPYDLSFLEMKNLCETDDRGPNNRPRRGMTSAGGQSLYKGTSLPIADRGSFFITDPTAHVVRRGLVTDQRGRRFLTHPHGEEEWLISPDVYFRPVNTTMGPDGAVYVVDMARGVIQDAPWLSPGPREYIRETGLEKVVRRGRIWRVSHRDHPWDGRQPRMLEESTAELVRHLSGPNGWWRLTAQRMIILREDRESVKPLLEDVVRYSQNPLGRLHALWTLEGCGLHQEVLTEALQDRDWRVRAAAIRMHEPMIKDGDASTIEHLSKLTGDAHPEVAKQLILSLGWTKDEAVFDLIGKAIERHPGHLGVTLAGSVALWKQETPTIAKLRSGEAFKGIRKENERNLAAAAWKEALAQWERGSEIGPEVAKEEVRRMQSGETLYFQSCVACHGADGKGIRIEGMEMAMAPPLAGSKRVTGPLDQLMPVLMNGMEGPVDGKSYQAGFMAPVYSLGITRDDRLAELVSYIRHAWGNKAPAVSKDEVKGWRKKLQHRKTPWTEKELSAMSEE